MSQDRVDRADVVEEYHAERIAGLLEERSGGALVDVTIGSAPRLVDVVRSLLVDLEIAP